MTEPSSSSDDNNNHDPSESTGDGETDAARDERLRRLWRQLNPQQSPSLDLPALQAGLARMHHPLTHADGLVRELLRACDLDHDGRVSYAEFVRFCRRTEAELWRLFKSIDRDHNGRLDERELKVAFERAGVNVDDKRLDRFFGFIDKNRDGEIDFAEWRDFLLFLPTHAPGMRQVMSFYTSTARISAEGDMHMSHEALTGIGTMLAFFATSVFGGIPGLVRPLPLPPPRPPSYSASSNSNGEFVSATLATNTTTIPDLVNARNSSFKLTDLVPDVGYFLAGGTSGITSRTATAPLDRLKVYLIAQTGEASAKQLAQAAKSGAALQATKHVSSTLWNACRELWAAGGVKSLFAGNGINVVKVMPESGVKFGCYEAFKRAIAQVEGHEDPTSISPLAQFTAGGLAGMASQAVVYPLDTLKFRVQTSTVAGGRHGTSLITQTAAQMFRQQGVYGFYRGLTMGLVGMFPYAAIDLFTFETLKKWLVARNLRLQRQQRLPSDAKYKYVNEHEEEEAALPSNFSLALMGGLSGAIGASAVYPVNLLRTRLQSQGTPGHPRTYTGIVDVTRQTLRGEGWRGLWKGLTPNLLKVVPAVSITYVMYENSKKWLQLR